MQTEPTTSNTNRRGFIRSGLLAAAAVSAPTILPSRVFRQDAPSKKITLGFIGMDSHGASRNLTSFLNEWDAKVLAICDVWKNKKIFAGNDKQSAKSIIYQRVSRDWANA
jgi:myo-inositol 2-dehydrogenase/D-chiro-inositol 1-dehydrogenase